MKKVILKNKNSYIKKSIKYFYYFYRFFSGEDNFLKINFLTKLDIRHELNKFET